MRKLCWQINSTLDGFMEVAAGELDHTESGHKAPPTFTMVKPEHRLRPMRDPD